MVELPLHTFVVALAHEHAGIEAPGAVIGGAEHDARAEVEPDAEATALVVGPPGGRVIGVGDGPRQKARRAAHGPETGDRQHDGARDGGGEAGHGAPVWRSSVCRASRAEWSRGEAHNEKRRPARAANSQPLCSTRSSR